MAKFIVRECGNSPKHAFDRAVEMAHVEKELIAKREGSELVRCHLPAKINNHNLTEHIETVLKSTIKNHNSPVCYIDLKEGEYIFFGYSNNI